MTQELVRWVICPHANYKLPLLIVHPKVLVVAPQYHPLFPTLVMIPRLASLGGQPVVFSFASRGSGQRGWGVSQLSLRMPTILRLYIRSKLNGLATGAPALKDVIYLADSTIVMSLFHQDPYCETQTVRHQTWSIDEMISNPTSAHHAWQNVAEFAAAST